MNPAKFLKNELLYNGHLQSIGAAGIFTIFSKILFGVDAGYFMVLLIYVLFESIFIFDRYYDLDWDAQTNTERTKHLLLYKGKIPVIFLLLITTSLLLTYVNYGLTALLTFAAIFLLGLTYPLFFKRLTRYIPLFKNIYVSLVYVPLSFLIAVILDLKLPLNILTIHIPIVIFVESMIAQIILDTKDLETDKKAHLKTLPVLIGNKNSLRVACALSVILASVSVSISALTNAPKLFLVMTVVALMVDLFILYKIKRGEKSGYLIAAGKFLIWFLIFIIYELIK